MQWFHRENKKKSQTKVLMSCNQLYYSLHPNVNCELSQRAFVVVNVFLYYLLPATVSFVAYFKGGLHAQLT